MPQSPESQKFSRDVTFSGAYGLTEMKERSEVVAVGGEKTIFPIEAAGNPVSTYIDMEEKLIAAERDEALAGLGDDISQAGLKEVNAGINAEVENWKLLTMFLQHHRNEFHIIDEKSSVTFPGDTTHPMPMPEYCAAKNIPVAGIDKFFLATVASVAEFKKFETAGPFGGIDVIPLQAGSTGSGKEIGVEMRLRNNQGKETRLVFIFADEPEAIKDDAPDDKKPEKLMS